VVLSFGVLSSIGQNLVIIPTLTIPMSWFPKRRGLASGIVVSGFGAGAFVFNQACCD
jgi:OFA family oxalate/formate antiporter-like MFS transporter